MLVIPLKNHKKDVIGVLQLINAIDPGSRQIVRFSPYSEYLINALASQAAMALTNAHLIRNLENLLSAFIQSMAAAIDEKSPYTGKHIKRVVDLTMLIARKINESHDENFVNIFFNEDELEELQLAAWLHDIGKIATPEYVVNKASKLEKIVNRIDLIETRFQLIESLVRTEFLNEKAELLNKKDNIELQFIKLEDDLKNKIDSLRNDFYFIRSCNNTGEFMPHEKTERIQAIAGNTYVFNDKSFPFLTDDEVENLCIRKGTLTDKERLIIENHARMTQKITAKLP